VRYPTIIITGSERRGSINYMQNLFDDNAARGSITNLTLI